MAQLTKRFNRGMSLVELLLCVATMGIVAGAAATVYVSSFKMMNQLSTVERRNDLILAVQFLSMRISSANLAKLDAASPMASSILKLRIDCDTNFRMRDTPNDYSDDMWMKFRIVDGRLRWRIDAAEAGDATATNAELIPGLVLAAGSFGNGDLIAYPVDFFGPWDEPVLVQMAMESIVPSIATNPSLQTMVVVGAKGNNA